MRLLPLLLLVGCSTQVEYKIVKVPVVYCPLVDIEQEPILAIRGITDNTPAGEVAQRYNASIVELEGYCGRLKETLMFYNEANAAVNELGLERIEIDE